MADRTTWTGTPCMSAKVFADTNILLYAYDTRDRSKHETAKKTLQELWLGNAGALSMQVLQEFYVNVTRKIAVPLPAQAARKVVEDYSAWCIETGPAEIAAAFSIEDQARIGFWDALIVAAAVKAGAAKILSEDLHPGQRIAGVVIENPFATA
ncbi:MAG: PIN domain-containing protein [Terracidiphilus sp.]